LDKKQTWNLGYWVMALAMVMLLQDVWQSANQVQTVPYSEFEQAPGKAAIRALALGPLFQFKGANAPCWP
jgi:cell division protease FtsH